jgi:hypothetical protein
MGYLQAAEMAALAPDRETALRWHLQSNHYPPVPTSMISVCEAAIDATIDGDYDDEIELPEGVRYQGNNTAPAWAIVEAHHLDAFIEGANL